MSKNVKRIIIRQFKEMQIRARHDPVWFAEKVLQAKLNVWQKDIANAVADLYRAYDELPTVINHDVKNYFTIRSPHGPGKTWIAAFLMHWWNFHQVGRVIATAPKEGQLKTRLFPTFSAIGSKAIVGYQGIIQLGSLKAFWGRNPEHFAVGETARYAESLAGYHHEFLLYIVEEASGVDENLFPAIEGALSTGTIVALVLIGNPTRNSGTFYMSHNNPIVSRDYFKYHVSLDKTTRVSKEWVDKQVRKYGKKSPIVKVRCYGEFADSDPAQLLSLEWIERARYAKVDENEGSIPTWTASIDVSDGGEDKTVIIISRVYESIRIMYLCKAVSFGKVYASHGTLDTLKQMIDNVNQSIDTDSDKISIRYLTLVVDSLGVGAAVRDEALRRGYNVIPFKGGEKSTDSEQWRNSRVECYWSLHNAFMNETIVYHDDFLNDEMDWIDYEGDLMMIRKKFSGERVEDIETKEQLIKREGKSPDYADATMMLYTADEPINKSMIQDIKGYGVIGESMIPSEHI